MGEPKLRILVVTNMYPTEENPWSGMFVKDTVDLMRIRELDVDVLFIKGRRTALKYVAGIFRLWWRMGRKKYDLLHAYYVYSGIVARAQFTHPVVLTLCGSDVNLPSQRLFSKMLSRMVSRTVVQTRRMRQLLAREGATVMHMGVNLSLVRPLPIKEARARLGLEPGGRFALFPYDPARRVKRHDLFSQAVELAKRKEPRLRPLMMNEAPRQLVATYMSAADVMVLTSESEGSPTTIKEALACGLPVVSVDVGDVAELIAGVEGCWLSEAREEAVAEGILKALSFGRRTEGRKRAEELSSEVTVEKLKELYGEVLREKRGPVGACQSRVF
ncbi:MAG: glycosyltransferase [Candidatus Eiseniibacteriota bacterium]|nr:MAG: glycosyltransferase [Candidatus Eisenbacteria bacterium]